MATTVQQIVEQADVLCAANLTAPVQWTKLRYLWQLEKNEGRSASKAYGTRPEEAEPAPGIIRNETLDHAFVLVLGDAIGRTDSDEYTQDVLDVLYDKADVAYKAFVNAKMNLSGTVIQVHERSIASPVFTPNGLVFLESRFLVKYRQAF